MRRPCSKRIKYRLSHPRNYAHQLYKNMFYSIDVFLRRKWEDIDHDLENSIAGALTSPSGGDGDGDPLGLGAIIECVALLLISLHV